jgi:hypothetical protein
MPTLDDAIQTSTQPKQLKSEKSLSSSLERGMLMSIVRNITGTLTREVVRTILKSLKGGSSDRRKSY